MENGKQQELKFLNQSTQPQKNLFQSQNLPQLKITNTQSKVCGKLELNGLKFLCLKEVKLSDK